MSNSLDSDQAQQFVGPDLGPNCLPRLSADNTGTPMDLAGCKSKSDMGTHYKYLDT